MTNKTGIILLSAGLDSYISLCLAIKKCDVILALTFDYGQKAAHDEIEAAAKIAKKYKINHKIIELPFLKEICNNALTNENLNLEFEKLDKASARAVWVPNRNGLFLNIAGAYADKLNADYIIFGANKEEAGTFPDNSEEFVKRADDFFEFSTLSKTKIYTPCLHYKKFEIINKGIEAGADFSLIKSCYNSSIIGKKSHCGKCESCKRLYNAILQSNNKDLINLIF